MTSVIEARRPKGVPLANGHVGDVFAAAGAFGFDGRGYFWQRPWHWLGLANPQALTVITKTIPYHPRSGNWRWWAPWRSVRCLGGGNMVNAMGLPGRGFYHFYHAVLPFIDRRMRLVASIWAEQPYELCRMVEMLCMWRRPGVVGIEVNLSCPNTGNHDRDVDLAALMVAAARAQAAGRLPLIAKLGCNRFARDLAVRIDQYVEAVDVINTVPWDEIYPDRVSPLAKYGYKGGVSGPAIVPFAREMTAFCTGLKHAKVISGGGVRDDQEAAHRVGLGAHAVSVGTAVTFSPGRANEIAAAVRSWPEPAEITR